MSIDGLRYDESRDVYELTQEAAQELREIASKALKSLDSKFGTESEWPYNLIEAIRGEEWEEELTIDQELGLHHMLKSLTARERACVEAMFREEKTLREIADDFGVTQERIRQVIAKALRKLRNPVRGRYLTRGYYAEKTEAYEQMIRQVYNRIEEERESAKRKMLYELRQIEAETNKYGHHGRPIDDLELSVRSHNALRKANLRCVEQILALPDIKELYKVRNLGTRSALEIVDKLRERGYTRLYNGQELAITDEGQEE